jgi:hypothetical protein
VTSNRVFVVKSYTFENVIGVYSTLDLACDACDNDDPEAAPFEVYECEIDGAYVYEHDTDRRGYPIRGQCNEDN